MRFYFTLLILLLTELVISQNAVLKGSTIEESNGKSLPGVTVVVSKTKFSTISDSEGNFIIRNIPPGKYDLKFSFVSFQTKTISDVTISTDDTTFLTVSMVENNNQLNEVVVTNTKAKAESIKSLLTMQKNSIRVSDGISAETIKRTPDKTTSDVLKRISGASVQDNKFVIIRGLNDRYNTSFLNGAPLPSSEPDRKAFSFDIFPANMIDNLVIYKTASPDLPGEFAGGVIEINTKSIPDKDFQSISVGSGYNTVTTGKDQVYYKGGNKDWIGIDDSTRNLPTSFPSATAFQSLQGIRSESSILQISSLAKSYTTDWKLYDKTFSPNTSFQYTIGRYFKTKEDQNFGFLVSLSHNKTNNYNEITRKSYEPTGVDSPGFLLTNQLDKNYSEQILFGGIANVSFKMDPNNSFSFKNLVSINSDNRVIDREGSITQESDPLYLHTTSRLFTSNRIYSGQLGGDHYFPESKLKVSWIGSYSKVNRSTPNDRRNTYLYTKFDDGTQSEPFALFSINTTGAEAPGSIFILKNTEDIYSTKIDVTKKIKLSESFNTDIKFGFFTQSRSRNFRARQLGYIPFNGSVNGINYGNSTFSQTIPFLDEASIFTSANMGIISPGVSGLTLFDGTKFNDSYTASSDLEAGYLMFDNIYNKFRFVWGLRVESYKQLLDSKSDAGLPVKVDNSQVDFLPSINLIYSVNKKQNIRLSFSKTLNRPEFRELAPFLFYDVATKFNTSGTPDLKIATILNYDLRYEIFPGKGQLFSFSAFYKKFQNPIELQAQANNSNQYKNAKSGENRGIEIEYRTLLSSIFGTEESKILDDFTFFTNVAIIKSKVDISNLLQSSSTKTIPLQGQSPYVFNAGLQYVNKEAGFSTSVNLNKIGDRIAIHENQTAGATVPALWEKGRTFIDGQITKSFLKNALEFKFNIQNILAEDQLFYQNNDLNKTNVTGLNSTLNNIFNGDAQNKNGYNSQEDDLVWLTKFGRTFSLTVSYTF